MEKLIRMNLLFDFYGQMLTERQKKFIELYYSQDLSLGEISEQYGVSRQSVYDTLKRSEQSLCAFEDKLGLMAKSLKDTDCLQRALAHLKSGSDSDIQKAKQILSDLIEAQER